MSTVVQSTCPGCKQPLRIPSDWLSQAVRCKQCGLVLQARSTVAAYAPRSSGIRPAVSARTPPPPSRAIQPPVARRPPKWPLPPRSRIVAQPAPAGAMPLAMATPAIVAAPIAAASPFDTFDADTSAPSRPSTYRRSRGGWWKGPVVVLGVLVVAGVVTAFSWPYIKEAMQGDAQQQASAKPDDKNREAGPAAPGPNDPVKEANTPNNKPNAPNKDSKDPKDPKDQKDIKDPKDPKDTKGPGGKNDPMNKPPDTTTSPRPSDPPKDPPKPPPDDTRKAPYPRRALVISVHNYLYANPVHAGVTGASARNLAHFNEALNKGLHIDLNQIAHLSDQTEASKMPGDGKGPRSPQKAVIEKTLADFLDSSRAQDCVLVFFIGHSVVIGDDTYLAPIEGELDNAETLIPLKSVYEQMAKCKARQKVLVMDVNRLNPSHGLERPNGGPMDPKADAAFAAPPDGVQVWTACVAGQQSYELDEAPEGAFIDRLKTALAPGKNDKGLEGVIQTPKDLMPVKELADVVNGLLKDQLSPYKLEQQSRLAGAPPADGAAYDKAEAPAPNAVVCLAAPPPAADMKEIQSVLDEVGTPPIKASNDGGLRAEALPPFPADKLAAYAPGGDMSDLRKAVLKARETIWALNTAAPPADIGMAVNDLRKTVKANLSIIKDGYKKQGDDAKFKDMILKDGREVADLMQLCDDALNEMGAVGEEARKMETKRWQVNYDFTLARLKAQKAYLMEYQSMLGQLRKQLPDLAPGQNGWKLAALPTPKGDSEGKRLAKDSAKLLDTIIKDNPDTPWAVLAKREKLTALGLQWQGARID